MKALILIDNQKGIDDFTTLTGGRNNPLMEENVVKLLKHWRKIGAPIFHVQHSSKDVNSPLHVSKPSYELRDAVLPMDDEILIVKRENSAFIDTDLQMMLQEQGLNDLVICGAITEHCVSTTTRMAANLGFSVELVEDACHACAKRYDGNIITAEQVHQTEIAILDGEFATIRKTDDFLKDN